MMKSVRAFAVAGLLVMVTSAHAAVGLFNTGVDALGNSLPDDAIDTHYTVNGGTAYAVTSAGGFPIGPWLGDLTTSSWISPATGTLGDLNQTYTYTTTFDLTGIDLTTASIAGRISTDDQLTGITINGNAAAIPVGITSFTYWTNFSVSSGFLSGLNTLSFSVLNNGGGPTGLRVEYTGNNFVAAVPEPSSYALALAGIATAFLVLRRRRSKA